MATNANETVVDDDKEVTEDDLRKLKELGEVETSDEADETIETNDSEEESEEAGEEDETNSDDQKAEETEEKSDDSTFVKEFPNIKGDSPEEYARNLEVAYKNSFTELHRLRDAAKTTEEGEKEELKPLDPLSLYAKQKMDEDMVQAFGKISKQYSEVHDKVEYEKFVKKVDVLSKTIYESENRLASPEELYSTAAVILGWEPADKIDSKDRLQEALKDRASRSKTTSATKPKSKSKVTDQQIAVARMTWATQGQSDAEIRQELEAHV